MLISMDVESLKQETTPRNTKINRSVASLACAIAVASLIGAATVQTRDASNANSISRTTRSANSSAVANIPSDLAAIANGDQAFIQYVMSGDVLQLDAFAHEYPAFVAKWTDEIQDAAMGLHGVLANMCVPDLNTYLRSALPSIPSSILGVDPRDLASGAKTLKDMLPAGVLDLDLHNTSVLQILNKLTGLDLTHMDLAALLGPNAAMLKTVETLKIDQLQAALNGFKVPDVNLSSISTMVKGMGLEDFDLSQIQSMIGGFDVDAIDLAAIGKSMSQYKSVTDMDLEGLLDQVNAFAHGPGPMVERSTRRVVREGLTLNSTAPVLRVERESHDLRVNQNDCVEILKNGTVYAGDCDKNWARLNFRDHHTEVSGEEAHLYLSVDGQGDLYGSAAPTTDFEFGVLAMLPMIGDATIMQAVMPVISYMMVDPNAAVSERGLDHLMADAMADLPAMMNLLPIVNVTLPEVMAGMKDPMPLLTKVLDTMDTDKLQSVIAALPALVAEDLSSILPLLEDIDAEYDFHQLAEVIDIITTTAFTQADIGDIKEILADLPQNIIPESFESMLGMLDSIDDDLKLVRLVSLVKTIFDEYTLSLHISVGEIEEIVDMLPESLASLLPSAVMDILAELPKKIEISDLLEILEYAVSRDWPKLRIKEFNHLISLVPKGALKPLMDVMGMQVYVEAIQKLLGMFPKNTQLRTLLALAGDASKIDFEHATFGTLSKFFGQIDKELVNGLLSGIAPGMTADKIGTLLSQFPSDLKVNTILDFAKKLGAMDLENATIGEFLGLLSEIDATVINNILATLGMQIDINSITGLMSKVDPAMKISSALDMAKTVTNLDLTTATIGSVEGLLTQVGLPTVDGLLKSFNVPVTGTQISGILSDFPPAEKLTDLLTDVQKLLAFMSGDVTQHTAGEFKSMLAHWQPVLSHFLDASKASMLGMVNKVLDMFPQDQPLADQIQTFDTLLSGLLTSSWDQAMKMLPMVPQALWDAVGVDPTSIITMLGELKSTASIADIFDAVKTMDLSTVTLADIRDVLVNKLHFDHYSFGKISSALRQILDTGAQYPGTTLSILIHALDVMANDDWNGNWISVGKNFEAVDAIHKDLGYQLMQAAAQFPGRAYYDGMLHPDVNGGGLWTCAQMNPSMLAANNYQGYPADDQKIQSAYDIAVNGLPAHLLNLASDFEFTAGHAAASINKITGTQFGDKLAECTPDQLKQWATLSPAPPATCEDIVGDACTCESVTTYINITSDIPQSDLDTVQSFYLQSNCAGEAKKEAIAAKKAMDAAKNATLKQKEAAKNAAHKAEQEEAARKEAKHQAVLSEEKKQHKKEVAEKKEALRQKHLLALSEAKQQHKQDLLDQQAAAERAAEEKRLAALSEAKKQEKLAALAKADALKAQDAAEAAEAKRLAKLGAAKKEKKQTALAKEQQISGKKYAA